MAYFIAPLRMHFKRPKSTLDSLESIFNGLGGNRRWVPLKSQEMRFKFLAQSQHGSKSRRYQRHQGGGGVGGRGVGISYNAE